MMKQLQASLAILLTAATVGTASAQDYVPGLELEEVGTITSVDSASNTVTISGHTMKLSPDTRYTTGIEGLHLNGLSLSWVGAKVGYQWYEQSGKGDFVTDLHFIDFGSRRGANK
jgi:hypothetical protein